MPYLGGVDVYEAPPEGGELSLDTRAFVSMHAIKSLSLLIATLTLTGMLAVSGIVADGRTAVQPGVSTDNSTAPAPIPDNDTFEVIARPVVATPVPDATTMPDYGPIQLPYYLYLNLSQSDYTPSDKVEIAVTTNAGVPTAIICDPEGNTANVDMVNVQGDVYGGAYKLDEAVVLGNYTVLAHVNGNGTNNSAMAFFNVTMGKSADEVLRIRYVAYDPAQGAIIVRANVSKASPDVASAVKGAPAMKGMNIKDVKTLAPYVIENGSGTKSPKADGEQVEVVIPIDKDNVDAVTRRFNITRDIVNATTSVTPGADGNSIRVSLNDKVDGCWYRMSAVIPDGYTVQKIVRADGTEVTNGIYVDDMAGEYVNNDINWYVDNGTLLFYDDPASHYTVSLLPDPVTITLYFHDDAGACFLNTSMSNSSNDHTTLPDNGGGFVWAQSQALANDFIIQGDPTVNIYVTSDSTSGNTLIDLQLSYIQGTTITTIGSYPGYQFKYKGKGPQLETVEFSDVPINTTVPACSKFVVTINSHTGNKRIATVWESTQYPSNFSATSKTWISVANVSIFNTAGNLINNTTPPSMVNVVANVTSPFGIADIDTVALVMYDGNGSVAIGPLPMSMNSSPIPPSNAWAFFEADVPINASQSSGNYTIIVTAISVDGITSDDSAVLQVNSARTSVTAVKSIASVGGDDFVITIEVSNNLGNTLSNVHVYDFYAADFIVGGFDRPHTTVSVSNALLQGNINVFGPFMLSPYQNATITYNARGVGDYCLLNMTIVGVDPYT